MKAITVRTNKGFTLIELLVVVAIIGILAAIAIPQFAQYRQRGFDARANSDLRNAATSEEAYFATNLAYIGCTEADQDGGCGSLPGFAGSETVTTTMSTGGTTAEPTFTGTSTSDSGSGISFTYDSAAGGMQ